MSGSTCNLICICVRRFRLQICVSRTLTRFAITDRCHGYRIALNAKICHCRFRKVLETLNVHFLAKQETEDGASVAGSVPQQWYHTLSWLLFNACYASALVITGGFWVLIYRPGDSVSLSTAITHASNSIYVIIDMFVSAVPVRVVHVWVPQTWSVIYGVFSFVYCALGGTGLYQLPYIYPFLDYKKSPGVAVSFMFIALLLILPVSQLLLFLLYRIRLYIYVKIYGGDEMTVATPV